MVCQSGQHDAEEQADTRCKGADTKLLTIGQLNYTQDAKKNITMIKNIGISLDKSR